jgi:hypothetical protein
MVFNPSGTVLNTNLYPSLDFSRGYDGASLGPRSLSGNRMGMARDGR